MRPQQYAQNMIDYLYEDGDTDRVLFGQIIGIVSYDQDDRPRDKAPNGRIEDAINIAQYLVASGDFSIGRTAKDEYGNVSQDDYQKGFDDFVKCARNLFSREGIDSIDLHSGIWLRKLKIGKKAPVINERIASYIN